MIYEKIKVIEEMKMKKKINLKLFIFILLVGFACLSIRFVADAKKEKGDTIYAGVYLDHVYVGGLSKEAAMEEYEDYIEGIEDLELTFHTSLGDYNTTLEEIGIDVSLEGAVEQAFAYGRKGNILTRYKEIKMLEKDKAVLVPEKTFDRELLIEKLETEASELTKEPKNASINRVDGEFVVYDGEVGQKLEVEKTVKQLEDLFEKEWKQEDIELDAVVVEKQPEYTAEDFYNVDSVLGRFQTEYNPGNTNRSKNLATASSKISGTVLMPGERFSVYELAAPFTEENGYANAGQYVNNELVDGIGGGLCQVSTTLYNAVLFSELEVNERYPHSLTVSYAKLSRDATIAGDYMDFKFTNSTDYPIYIDGYAGGGTVSFAIYGHETRPSNRTIDFETKIIKTKEPPKPEKIKDDTMEKGEEKVEQEAHTGYYTELWKHIYVDGELKESVRVNQSQYQAQPAKIRVGTKKVKDKDKDKDKDKNQSEESSGSESTAPSESETVPSEPSENGNDTNSGETATEDTTQVESE